MRRSSRAKPCAAALRGSLAPRLAVRRTGHGSGQRLENLGFDRKIVEAHFVMHAIGAVVQIAQTEILRQDVLHLSYEFAIPVADQKGALLTHLHEGPTCLHVI